MILIELKTYSNNWDNIDKHCKVLTLLIFTFLSIITYSQDELVLQSRIKTQKTRKIDLDRNYTIKTKDTLYFSKIINHSERELSIIRTRRLDLNWITDTLKILHSDIEYIKKDWFKSRNWLVPSMYCAMFSVAAVIFLPIAAIDNGKEGVKEWLTFETILIGLSYPALFIGTRSTKFDLKNEWIII